MVEAVLKGLGLGFILILSVGPVIFTVIKQSINNGREGGFAFVTGVWISDILLVAVSNAFSEWVSALMEYRKLIAFMGSGFLVMMGLYFVFFKKIKVTRESASEITGFTKGDFFKIASSGFFINTLNPSVILFWLINATAFAVTHSYQQRIIIFSVCILINIIADIGKVMMAGKLRSRLTLQNISIINKISGTILVVFGMALFWGAALLRA